MNLNGAYYLNVEEQYKMQGARALAAIVLTYLSHGIPVSTPERLRIHPAYLLVYIIHIGFNSLHSEGETVDLLL